MSSDSEFGRLLEAEESAEAAWLIAQRCAARRHDGVAWSGLGPDPVVGRAADVLQNRTAGRLAALRDWRDSRRGRLLAAMTEAERAVETVRATLARGLALDDRRCLAAIASLAQTARSAMDAAAPGGLSEAPCATSIASSSPSTASRTNSHD